MSDKKTRHYDVIIQATLSRILARPLCQVPVKDLLVSPSRAARELIAGFSDENLEKLRAHSGLVGQEIYLHH